MIGKVALLAGLFVVPAVVLLKGHRFRYRTKRYRRIFWGAIIGHSLGVAITLVLLIFPPVAWQDGSGWRDFLVHWSMLLGGAAGALVALAWQAK